MAQRIDTIHQFPHKPANVRIERDVVAVRHAAKRPLIKQMTQFMESAVAALVRFHGTKTAIKGR